MSYSIHWIAGTEWVRHDCVINYYSGHNNAGNKDLRYDLSTTTRSRASRSIRADRIDPVRLKVGQVAQSSLGPYAGTFSNAKTRPHGEVSSNSKNEHHIVYISPTRGSCTKATGLDQRASDYRVSAPPISTSFVVSIRKVRLLCSALTLKIA